VKNLFKLIDFLIITNLSCIFYKLKNLTFLTILSQKKSNSKWNRQKKSNTIEMMKFLLINGLRDVFEQDIGEILFFEGNCSNYLRILENEL
jgi:hypothetical protein